MCDCNSVYEQEPENEIDCDLSLFPLQPRRHQHVEIAAMSRHKKMLNKSRLGLGKTLSAVYASKGRTLVSCPNLLVEQWYKWLNGVPENDPDGEPAHPPFAPLDRQRIVMVRGNYNEKLALVQQPADFTIVNQEMLQTHGKYMRELAEEGTWQTFIIDEAHHMRNHEAKRSYTAAQIAKHCEYVFPLTGTPIWKEVDDLYMLFHMIAPDIFKSYWWFVDNFCIAEDTQYGTKVKGVKKSMLPELEQILEMVSTGHTYEQAGREIPPVIKKYVTVDFPKDLKTIYDNMVLNYRLEFEGLNPKVDIPFSHISQVMRTMRMLTAPVKYKAVQEIIDELHDTNPANKIIIFCWYREVAEELARQTGGTVIHGGIPKAERRGLAMRAKIVCATLATLTEGVDLSAARAIIFVEEHYTPGSLDQSTGRVVRERQDGNNKEPVHMYYVHVRGTIDQVIHRAAQKRGFTIAEVIKEALLI